MVDLTNAPPGVAEYAAGARNKTNRQLWTAIQSFALGAAPGAPLDEYEVWKLRVDLAELRRRLSAWTNWLDGEDVPLPDFSDKPSCAKCGNADKITKRYCAGRAAPKEICWIVENADGEHMHRKCPDCGHEWLEGCKAR